MKYSSELSEFSRRTRVRRIDGIFLSALLLLAAILLVSYRIKVQIAESNRWASHSYQVLEMLDDLDHSMLEAQSSRLRYILTRNSFHKQQYALHRQSVPPLLAHLKELTADDKRQRERMARLAGLLDEKIRNIDRSIADLDGEGYRADRQSQLTEEGAALMLMIGGQIQVLEHEEQNLLAQRRARRQQALNGLTLWVGGGIVVAAGLLSVTYFVARREARDHFEAATALESANRDVVHLSEMTQFLQSAATVAEAGEILSRYGPRFFEGDFGGVYLLNSSRNLLSELALWGDFPSELFTPEQCWSLRMGQPHVAQSGSGLTCSHVTADVVASICVPLAAQHETLGVLHVGLTSAGAGAAVENKKAMAIAFAEQAGLALRNLQLREQLRELSIRDPLTGLLNRRYLEESLIREISRATRNKQSLALVMLDVDHFKKFNDRFGHEAGDFVLKEFGHFLQRYLRGSDTACRFGGEEFTLILPEANREAALLKANQLREAVKGLQLVHGKQSLGRITVSAGIAVYPDDGESGQDLLTSADAALYRAKGNGRDRVEASAV